MNSEKTSELVLDRFEIVYANDSLLDDCYRIRHQAYCVDNDFLPRSADGRECDADDARSQSILVRHRPTDTFVGTARLIFDTGRPLPVFTHTRVQNENIIRSLVPQGKLAEISRFAAIRRFEPRLMSLVISLGIIRLSAENGIQYWVSAMAPTLNKTLSTFGLDLMPAGPLTDYHGKRRAYFGVVADVVAKSREKAPDVWGAV